MTDYKLRYGEIDLQLQESKHLIGLRPKPGMSGAMETAVGAFRARKATAADGNLGGFEIVEVERNSEAAGEILDSLRSDNTVKVGTHVFHTSDDGVPFVPTGELYIVFKPEADDAAKQKLLDNQRLELIEARDDNKLVVRTTRDSHNPIKVAMALQAAAIVDIAEPELATPGALTGVALPTDARVPDQWHLHNTGRHRGTTMFFKEGADARVVDAWRTLGSLGSQSIVVAVIDDGFDLTHPDLGGAGKVVHPYDFTRNSDDPSPGPGDAHGTACAGVAVGRSNGGDIVGSAPNASLMPLRWGRGLTDGQIEKWFDHARLSGADVVSCSWKAQANRFALSQRAADAIESCAKNGRDGKGCVVVFAAGNDNQDINSSHYKNGFALHPDVIAVAACTSRDQKSHYSNHGDRIWLTAPSSGAGGAGILTADVTGYRLRNGNQIPRGYADGDYSYDFGGTSSACPLVAGISALVLSANPALTAGQVKGILRKTARRIGPSSAYDRHGHSKDFGYGCIDANAAVKAAIAMRTNDNGA